MRGLIGLGLALLVAGAVAMLAMRGGAAGVPAGPRRAPQPPGPPTQYQPPAEAPPKPEAVPEATDTRVPGDGPAIEVAIDQTGPDRGGRRVATFDHVVNGALVPGDIRRFAGLSDADAALVQRETAAENAHIVRALRALIATLPDFRHTADEVAKASALDLMTWVAQYQPMQLEMAQVTQVMDEDEDRRFRLERVPWDEFPFPEDGLVMRYARTMHEVRKATVQRLADGGMEAAPLDQLRSRYLLDGHFRLAPDKPFEFGRPPSR